MSFRNSARSRAVCSSLFAMGFSFHIYFSRFCFSGNNRVITCSRSRSSSEPPSRADEAHGAKPGGTTRPGSSRLASPRSALRPRPALSRGSLAVVLPPFSGRRENGGKLRVALTAEVRRARRPSNTSCDLERRGKRNRVLCIQGELRLCCPWRNPGRPMTQTERAFAGPRDGQAAAHGPHLARRLCK